MMNKISRRSFLQAAGGVAAAAALTACGGKTEADKGSSQNGKIQITFYLWDRSMMKELTPWLEQKFPEYEFNFIQGFNTMDYYRDLLNRAEQLPGHHHLPPLLPERCGSSGRVPDGSEHDRGCRHLLFQLPEQQSGAGRCDPLAAHVRRGGRHGCKCRSVCSVQYPSAHQLLPSSWRPLMPLRLSALRAIRQTGDMTTPV